MVFRMVHRGVSTELTEEERAQLEAKSGIGKDVGFKVKGRNGIWNPGTIVDEVYVMVGDYKHVIQRIKLREGERRGGNEYAYRAGHWTYRGGRINWGQYAPFLTETEFGELLTKARAKGWPIFQ